MKAVRLKPKPNSTISGMVRLLGGDRIFTNTRAMVAFPKAYQPIWVKPSRKSDSLLPDSPKQKRPISTELRPLRQAIRLSTAAYRPSSRLPAMAAQIRVLKSKAMPILPPANMVAVKKVKPNKRMEVDSSPLRAPGGTSLRG